MNLHCLKWYHYQRKAILKVTFLMTINFFLYIYSDPSISYMYVRLGCSDICYCDFRLHKKIVSFLYAHIPYMKCTLINTMYIHFVVYLPLTKRWWIWVYSFPVWWECHLLYSLSCVPDTEGELSSMFDSRTLHWIQRGQRWNEILCTKFNGNWCNRFQMKL